MNSAGAKWPELSSIALANTVAIGKNTNSATRARTNPNADAVKASPSQAPRAAKPWHSNINKASIVSKAP